MQHSLVIAAAVLSVSCVMAGESSEKERKELEAWAKSLDKASVHKAVLKLEQEPLGEAAELIRPALAVYFEDLDYEVCLDQLSGLVFTKNKAHLAVFFQVVFASGDFFIQHPEESKDKTTYMLAGLESGLNAYQRVLALKPEERLEFLDQLLKLRTEGRLKEHITSHMCKE
jgi:hypothetical protein